MQNNNTPNNEHQYTSPYSYTPNAGYGYQPTPTPTPDPKPPKNDKKSVSVLTLVICIGISVIISVVTSLSVAIGLYGEDIDLNGGSFTNQNTDNNTDIENGNTNNTPGSNTTITIEGEVESMVEAVYQKAANSVVGIRTTASVIGFFGGSTESTGEGSGVIYSTDGYIITNYHVIADVVSNQYRNTSVEVFLMSTPNSPIDATVVGYNVSTDLAVLKISKTGLPAIETANSDQVKVGQYAVAIGSPGGIEFLNSVSYGIISGLNRSITVDSIGEMKLIQTDAAINPGNSGGALVNTRGELIGINAMIYSQTGSYSGYGFAIPTTIMRKVVDDLKEFGTVQRAMLGVIGKDVSVYLDEQHEKGNNVDLGTLTGVYVNDVSQDGAAAKGGLQKGDVIIAIDGNTIEKFGQLQELMAGHRPGDKVEVTYLRNKKKHTTRLTLRNVQGTEGVVESIGGDKMGAALRPLSDTEKQQLALRHGLMVTAVKNGKMSEAGITKGIIIMQVNDREMHTVADFDEAVRAANMSTDRVLWIRAKTQSGINRSYTVELSDNANLKNKK